MRYLRSLGISVLAVLFVESTVAQQFAQPPNIQLLLAGTTSHTWSEVVKTGYLATVNPPLCTQPTTYQFFSDGHVIIQECSHDTLKSTSHSWSVQATDAFDITLQIDSTSYVLLVKTAATSGTGDTHILLRLPSVSKIIEVSDIDLVQIR
jgi:hypothetical protein